MAVDARAKKSSYMLHAIRSSWAERDSLIDWLSESYKDPCLSSTADSFDSEMIDWVDESLPISSISSSSSIFGLRRPSFLIDLRLIDSIG